MENKGPQSKFLWCSLLIAGLNAPWTAVGQTYYRIDTGISKSTSAGFEDKSNNPFLICGDAACNRPGSLKDFGGATIFGGGIGKRVAQRSRVEATLGYRAYELDASDASVPATRYKADVRSVSLVGNGFIDFDATGWNPHFGIGLGVAQNKLGTLSFNDGAGFSGSVPGGTKTDVVFALMLGAGIPLSHKLILDIGYRRINLGKVETGSGVTITGSGNFPYSGASGQIKANELTVGLRF